MEPASVNPPEADDPLETLLREATPRIPDHGFSSRVMAAVDVDRRRARIRLCSMLVGGATGLGIATAAGAFGVDTAHAFSDLQRSFFEIASLAANPSVMIATIVIVAALIYVFRRGESDLRSR
jgi:hypothetical protein